MRVISGTNSGQRLKAPKGLTTRPTEDRIKENIFNLIGQTFQGEIALDLFAGSGANGIEFLSRGCSFCYFIDINREAISTIRQNLDNTKLNDKAKVLRENFKLFLEQTSEIFDYIFIDPPYEKYEFYEKTVELISKRNLLRNNGLLIFEHKSEYDIDLTCGFELYKYKNYKNTSVTIWRKTDESNICR